MTQPPNPIMQGFRAARRDPAVFLLEILWRWSFAMVALLALFCAGALLLDRVHIDSLFRAFQSKDPRTIGAGLFFTWVLLGVKAILAAIAVPLLIALIWACFAAPARRIIVRRLRPDGQILAGRPMFALHLLRALAAWIAALLLVGALAEAINFATSRSRTDLSVFYSVAAPAVVLIVASWLVLNWYLSIAAVFGRAEHGFRAAFRHGRLMVARQRSDFAGTGLVFLFLRLLLLALVLAVCGLASGMIATAPEKYAVLLLVMALAFFAAGDFLYVARFASYLALAAAQPRDREQSA